ncbi:uncharacterized protein DEA37_0000927 [Paragonimus westermani]|uniref:G-protein coupled receptors family 1 profile domain-containing protein n=1 Tax=Paragonimus westermani TaxID=34504 RepID=A0A5J4N7Z9_9TREM|nr:uncharacterized protein DEA37_0000927 [Paragonimus westermani]
MAVCTGDIPHFANLFISLVGVLFNFVVFAVLFEFKIGSLVTNALLRNQSLFAGCACLFVFISHLTNKQFYTNITILDMIICQVTSSNNLFWLAQILYVHNLICMTFDRLLAVLCPIWYRNAQQKLIGTLFVYLTFMVLILYPPLICKRGLVSGVCDRKYKWPGTWIQLVLDNYSYIWAILIYFVPIVLLFSTHIFIFCKLRKSSGKLLNVAVKGYKRSSNVQLNRLLLTTVSLTLLYTICYSLNTLYFLFAPSKEAIIFEVGTMFIVICSCLNPCAMICMNLALKRHLKSRLLKSP